MSSLEDQLFQNCINLLEEERDVQGVIAKLQPLVNTVRVSMLKRRDGLWGDTLITKVINLLNKGIAEPNHPLRDLLPIATAEKVEVLRIPGKNGSTPLHVASRKDAPSAVGCIVDLIPEAQRENLLFVRDENFSTSVHVAARYASSGVIRKLLECLPPRHMINLLRTKDRSGRTPLYLSPRNRNHRDTCLEILRFINTMEQQFPEGNVEEILSLTTPRGDTFLHNAAICCESDTIERIVSMIPRPTGNLLKDKQNWEANWEGKTPRDLAKPGIARDQLDQLGEYPTAIYPLQTPPTIVVLKEQPTPGEVPDGVESDFACVRNHFRHREIPTHITGSTEAEIRTTIGEAQQRDVSAIIVFYFVVTPNPNGLHDIIRVMTSDPRYIGKPKVLVTYGTPEPIPFTQSNDFLLFIARPPDAISTFIGELKRLDQSTCISKACQMTGSRYTTENILLESTLSAKFCIGKDFDYYYLEQVVNFNAEHPESESSDDDMSAAQYAGL